MLLFLHSSNFSPQKIHQYCLSFVIFHKQFNDVTTGTGGTKQKFNSPGMTIIITNTCAIAISRFQCTTWNMCLWLLLSNCS